MKFFEKLFRFSQYVRITRIPPVDTVEPPPPLAPPQFWGEEREEQPQSALLLDEIAELKDAMQKLGRNQFRANALAESERKEIKQMLQQTLALSTEPQRETLLELLLVVDGLEEGIRALKQLKDENALAPAWADGFRMVHERLLRVLKKWNVTPMESFGQPFAPHRHRAVDVVHTNEVAENLVVEEQRRGYLCGEEVLRYAEVIVARKANHVGATP